MTYRQEAGKTPEQIESEIAMQRRWTVYQEYRFGAPGTVQVFERTCYLDVPGGRLWLYEFPIAGAKTVAMTFQPDVPPAASEDS